MSAKVFVIDTARCTGCHACSMACKDRADLPDEFDLVRIEERETGTCPETAVSFRVVHCFHCAEPPCAEACPAGALSRDEGGLVSLDLAECTGCGECVEACPFRAIVVLPGGKAAKCDGCADEVARGLDPTCVRACPMRAMAYVPSEDVKRQGRTVLIDGHGIGPAVLYLVRVRSQAKKV